MSVVPTLKRTEVMKDLCTLANSCSLGSVGIGGNIAQRGFSLKYFKPVAILLREA